ncbi:hypothetical protein GGU10DRAFT_354351 [Lentinula aff. detonsa]|uniref:BZIP domain-containing protein n=1 Tax=Lentinula aff. detonsa TaxID=2804958 RepID=A0AA38KQH8_9AGAR|nr:hypothetical protein GGU10DRAFT_354351 [Lentinula aff. detonsa]
MDSGMYSYPHHYNPAEMQDVPVASSSYDPLTAAYLQNQSARMPFSGTSHSSYAPEPQQDSQSSYLGSESLPTSHHPYMDLSGLSSASSSGRGTTNPRNGSPKSPRSPDHPLPQAPRTRRSPASRHLPLPDDFDDDSDDEPLPPNASERERLEWKKRRNTKAARRSRKRKMIYTERLEANVEKLRLEKEMWRTRALTLRQLLKSHNLPCPDFDD